MKVRQKNKTRWPGWAAGVLFVWVTGQALAVSAPEYSILAKPNKSYPADQIVRYRVGIRWQENAEKYRLQPPVTELDNLEYLGTSEEVTADPGTPGQSEQILTFRFKGKKPGPARIRRLRLRWLDDTIPQITEHSLEIPGVELTITRPLSPGIIYGALASAACFLAALSLVIFFRSRKRPPFEPARSLESEMTAALEALREGWKRQNQADFLSALNRTAEHYLAQKLDWNRTRDGYNILRTRAERKWSKREAAFISQFLETLEESRFSGTPLNDEELLNIYQAFCTFMKGRQ